MDRPSLIVFQVRNYYISTDATQETGNVPFENNDISSYICDFRQNKKKVPRRNKTGAPLPKKSALWQAVPPLPLSRSGALDENCSFNEKYLVDFDLLDIS